MGAELIAHFPLDACSVGPAAERSVSGGDPDADDAAALALMAADAGTDTIVTARLSPRSTGPRPASRSGSRSTPSASTSSIRRPKTSIW